jgi:hypothetical protein
MTIASSVTNHADPGRVARCSCGGLSLHLSGDPRRIYGCACIECQRATGTAFAYRAIFADEAVREVVGEVRSWRRISDVGRWIDQHFCPGCGTLLYMSAEALPGAISVSMGCFVERDFPAPAAIHNLHRAAPWLDLAAFAPAP